MDMVVMDNHMAFMVAYLGMVITLEVTSLVIMELMYFNSLMVMVMIILLHFITFKD